ncbi:hypothetical protein V0U79_01940 [Hyphobacterium sp. HN65]|uniref:Uncharacterized protein n=1 Tax=Hyphobacterium lacteum TaxID=3116575 RepID=A0ABU7LMI7_9PROT|nr:hypothetical protein [Hyphobacterium sp. HN65]MEE2525109.1 hypothetical protein [Hyphobacterium sp. HN65]
MINRTKESVRRLRDGQSWKENGFALTLVGAMSSAGLGALVISTMI